MNARRRTPPEPDPKGLPAMPIPVSCPSCEATFQAADEHAGKRGKCRRCGEVVPIPAQARAGAGQDLSPEEVGPATVASRVAGLEPLAPATADEDAGVYELAGASTPKKARAVRVREGALPAAGVGAAGVREAAAPTAKTLSPGEILSAFRGEIEPVRPTLLYRAWILIVAGIMVLLPLVYVALVGLVAAGVLYHAVHNIAIFGAIGGSRSGAKAALALYVTPLVLGGVVVAFMLKPLFARPAKRPKQKTLDPSDEPLLHAFVDGVCTSVNSPRPARIEVDCQVNASAHREGGLLGLFGGRLVLTVGLPLAAGLSLRQFAGVLAHEFGHFSQGAGMRLYGLIMRVNRWFARVVYERDEWDESLEGWSHAEHWGIAALGHLAKAAVWLTRRVLQALMWVGHAASAFLSRQMEFDADRYEARMVGGEAFASTCHRLRELGLAEQGAFADLQSSWQQRRLPDNFPKLVMANVPQIPEPVRAAVDRAIAETKTGLFDTHPADRDRIERARDEEPGEGIFHLSGPSTDLFRDFDALARGASYGMYKSMLGPALSEDQLFEVAELVQDQAAAQEGYVAAQRFLAGAVRMTSRLPLARAYPRPPADPASAKEALIAAREALAAGRDEAAALEEREDDARRRLYQADVAWTFLKAGVPVKASEFGIDAATTASAERSRRQAESALAEIEAARAPLAEAAASRLTHALAILELDTALARVPDGPGRREEAHALYPCVAHLAGVVVPEILNIAHARGVLGGLLGALQGTKEPGPDRINAVLRAASRLRDDLEQFRRKVGDAIEYPFEHATEGITLGKFALPAALPEKEQVGELMGSCGEAIDRLFGLYRRALGRLCVTAEEVEKALGLPPIELPESDPAGG